MLPRPRVWLACRAMAVRARPRQSATPPIAWSSPRATVRRYTDDAGPKPPATAFSSIQPDETNGLSSANSAPGSAEQRSEPAVANETQTSQAEEDEADNGAELLRAAMAQDGVATPDGALTPEQELALYHEGRIPTLREAEEGLELEEGEEAEFGEHGDGFKFAPPATPMPPNMHLKKRYHPVLDQLVRLLMRDGKLSAAQKHMSHVLNFLRTSPPPIVSERRPLLPGAPPPSHLPLNPVLYLTVAVDSVAPLIRVLRLRDAGGGGRSLEVPLPLSVRQRRRQAWLWIMDVVNAKPSMGSGRKQLAHRIADELIAIVEGRSSVWEKKATLQKMATAARVNVAELGRKRKKKMGGR